MVFSTMTKIVARTPYCTWKNFGTLEKWSGKIKSRWSFRFVMTFQK